MNKTDESLGMIFVPNLRTRYLDYGIESHTLTAPQPRFILPSQFHLMIVNQIMAVVLNWYSTGLPSNSMTIS